MHNKDKKIDVLKNLSKSRVGKRSTKMVSISISNNTHQKISNLCWILHNDERPKISMISNNIIEQFIEDYKNQILELQSRKKDLF